MSEFDLQVRIDQQRETIGRLQEQVEERDERIAKLEALVPNLRESIEGNEIDIKGLIAEREAMRDKLLAVGELPVKIERLRCLACDVENKSYKPKALASQLYDLADELEDLLKEREDVWPEAV